MFGKPRSILPDRWNGEEQPRVGEGVSRPRFGARTREFRLIVYPKGAPPITWTTKAEDKRSAIKYAQSRWPGSEVEVMP
jgi:hypothetical protein